MNTKILNPNNNDDIELSGKIIKNGGLVAIPTETVYGLAANALNPESVKNIYKVKGRPSDNPLIVHISNINQLAPLVSEIPEMATKLAEKFWPGPLTIILPKSHIIPKETSGGLDTVAVRLPASETARKIITASGCPIAAPSANLSGKPSPTTFDHIYSDLNGKVEGIVKGESCAIGVESTVITLVTKVPKILRPGGITKEQLEEVLGTVEVDKAVTGELENKEDASSPGMKYKHYSPKSKIIIADMSLSDYVKLVNESENFGALCFEGEEKFLNKPYVTYGKAYDGASQGQKLFEALYELDRKNIKQAYARCPQQNGVGLAVYNRLIRSAGFDFIKSDVSVIGLTGTTGAGKTTVSSMFRSLGVSVIDCDEITKDENIYKGKCLLKLKETFGEDIVKDNKLDRKLLGKRAFSSKEKTEQLNKITLPVIKEEINRRIDILKQQGNSIIIIDAPTLFEAKAEDICCKIITVNAPLEIRRERIMKRDNLSLEDANLRINAQLSESFFLSHSDFVIENTNDEITILNRVKEIITEVK